ncbi:hypothetical protein EV121DRAFT_293948 [Schizophyllum commune]
MSCRRQLAAPPRSSLPLPRPGHKTRLIASSADLLTGNDDDLGPRQPFMSRSRRVEASCTTIPLPSSPDITRRRIPLHLAVDFPFISPPTHAMSRTFQGVARVNGTAVDIHAEADIIHSPRESTENAVKENFRKSEPPEASARSLGGVLVEGRPLLSARRRQGGVPVSVTADLEIALPLVSPKACARHSCANWPRAGAGYGTPSSTGAALTRTVGSVRAGPSGNYRRDRQFRYR